MTIVDSASIDDNTHGGGEIPSCTGLTPDALPEVHEPVLAENLQSGVSTRNVPLPKDIQEARREARTPHWFVLRCTYGREKKSAKYLQSKNIIVYYPTEVRVKLVDGKRKNVEESFFPNLIFVYGMFNDLKTYVYNNEH